ncbi:MAG TPA: hypothetical protein ENN17_05380 [bacterium]|nr:hypothetical protein [bacterium]
MENHEPVRIGHSQLPDSVHAAAEAAGMILEQMGPSGKAGWALVFCGGRHDRNRILQTLRAELGDIDMIGGAAVGTITRDSLGYGGYECAVAAFPATFPTPRVIADHGLDAGEFEAGCRLGERIGDAARDGDTVLLFYDSVRGGPPPVLYIGSRLVDGIHRGLGNKTVTLIGAGTVADFHLSDSFVFDGRDVAKHAAVAVVLPSNFLSRTTIMHGCIPLSAFLEITRIDGAVLYELEGRPARDLLLEMAGTDDVSMSLTIGEKHGDPFAPYDESAYANRLILRTDPENGSATLFEADFREGTRVQIMARDNRLMLESAAKRTRELLDALQGTNPVFALYIDCAGRSRAFSGAESEEAGIVRNEIGGRIPLLGFYSGVEIAPLLGKSRPLDWTGVLTVFTV